MRILLPFLALYRKHWFRITLGMILAIIAIVANISLLAISGWFLSATAIAGFAGLYTFNYLFPAGGVRVSAILRTTARYAERLVSHDATFRVLAHLRVQIFRKLLPLAPAGIAKFRQADLLNRLIADINTLDHLYLRVLAPLISAIIVVLLTTIGLSVWDRHLALLLASIMLSISIIVPILFYYAGKPIGYKLTDLRGQYRIQLTSWLQGQAEIVIFGALTHFRQRLDKLERLWLQQQKKQAHLSAFSSALMTVASGFTVTLMLWLVAGGIGGHAQPGALIALFVFVTLAAFEALAPIASTFQHLGHVIASANRVNQLLTTQPSVIFPECAPTRLTLAPMTVSCVDMSFTYPGQPQPVLSNIDLHIPAGKHVALLGKTGCGKSTLIQLISRAWDPQHGEILLDNVPLTQLTEPSIRNSMSIVSQRIHVFNATLRDNLILAAPNATDQQLCEKLQQVGLSNLLEGEGLSNWLGEGGRQLSGGEQRRLGIARALLHPASLLLLDEPTEGLDVETEQHILALLHEHCRDKTLIFITHRLTHMHHFDQICVMDAGHIIEVGDHQSLLKSNGMYANFYQTKKGVRNNV